MPILAIKQALYLKQLNMSTGKTKKLKHAHNEKYILKIE